MALADGDRVRLLLDRHPEGTVIGDEYEGRARVRLDNTQTATFMARDLEPIESKAWPPTTVEGK